MPKPDREKYSDSDVETAWVGKPPVLNSTVTLADYDPGWPALHEREAARIRQVLGDTVVLMEHVGSTSVPGLCAKPIIDILLVVPDSDDEDAYVPRLEAAGYVLTIREPDWEKHRAFKGPDTNINLHVYSPDTKEIERYRVFRDRLRSNQEDRDLYAATKRNLAARKWKYIQNYADAKNDVVDEIMSRALGQPVSRRDPAPPMEPDQYDGFAADYAEHARHNPYQELYDRPAILALSGELDGRKVLDIGCAAGHLTAALADRGADVVGLDGSPALVDVAKREFGDRARFQQGDLTAPLDFADGTFDLVTASLVLHYLEDWGPVLAELRRVLRPGGALVLSVHHPEDWHWFDRPDYFRREQVTDQFALGGREVDVRFYRRPLSQTFGALREAGFTVDVIDEPMPLPECREISPRAYASLTTTPRFLYFRALAPHA
ncbi:GrpB family protein [Saccharothrix sp. AJ9571]|nr:GrpB family protein [Saccharothrix sp. AJ9571]